MHQCTVCMCMKRWVEKEQRLVVGRWRGKTNTGANYPTLPWVSKALHSGRLYSSNTAELCVKAITVWMQRAKNKRDRGRWWCLEGVDGDEIIHLHGGATTTTAKARRDVMPCISPFSVSLSLPVCVNVCSLPACLSVWSDVHRDDSQYGKGRWKCGWWSLLISCEATYQVL